MTVQHIGNRAMSLYISGEELTRFDLEPAQIGREEALRLLTIALAERRLDGWEAAELEVYPGSDSVLLFARRKSGAPKHFHFADFEALITAAHLCPDVLPSSLACVAGGYILTVYPFEGERPPAILSEFGSEMGSSVYLTAHLLEQGAGLLSASALQCLRRHFTPAIPGAVSESAQTAGGTLSV